MRFYSYIYCATHVIIIDVIIIDVIIIYVCGFIIGESFLEKNILGKPLKDIFSTGGFRDEINDMYCWEEAGSLQ